MLSVCDPERAFRLFTIILQEQIRAMVEDDTLQTQAVLVIQFLAVGAMLAPKKTLDVFDQRRLRSGISTPVAETFGGKMAEQSSGVILALLDEAQEILQFADILYNRIFAYAQIFRSREFTINLALVALAM